MGREIAKVMTYHGADWLERSERVKEERPDLVLRAFDLAERLAVADIGAGTGYYARRIAEHPRATVFAVDIQPEMLKRLRRETDKQGIRNVKPVLATPTDLRLEPASLDLAVMIDVYHELEHPYETLGQIVRALKPGGRVVFVEYRTDDPRVPIKRVRHVFASAIVGSAAVAHLRGRGLGNGTGERHADRLRRVDRAHHVGIPRAGGFVGLARGERIGRRSAIVLVMS